MKQQFLPRGNNEAGASSGFSNYTSGTSLDTFEDYDEAKIDIDTPLCARTVFAATKHNIGSGFSNYTSGMSLDTFEDYDEAKIDIDTPLCVRTVFAATKHNNGSGFSNCMSCSSSLAYKLDEFLLHLTDTVEPAIALNE